MNDHSSIDPKLKPIIGVEGEQKQEEQKSTQQGELQGRTIIPHPEEKQLDVPSPRSLPHESIASDELPAVTGPLVSGDPLFPEQVKPIAQILTPESISFKLQGSLNRFSNACESGGAGVKEVLQSLTHDKEFMAHIGGIRELIKQGAIIACQQGKYEVIEVLCDLSLIERKEKDDDFIDHAGPSENYRIIMDLCKANTINLGSIIRVMGGVLIVSKILKQAVNDNDWKFIETFFEKIGHIHAENAGRLLILSKDGAAGAEEILKAALSHNQLVVIEKLYKFAVDHEHQFTLAPVIARIIAQNLFDNNGKAVDTILRTMHGSLQMMSGKRSMMYLRIAFSNILKSACNAKDWKSLEAFFSSNINDCPEIKNAVKSSILTDVRNFKILESALVYDQVSLVQNICRFAVDSGLTKELQEILQTKDREGMTCVDYAKALGQQEVLEIFKEVGVATTPNAQDVLTKEQARRRLITLNAQLFDSYNFEISANQGAPTMCALLDMIAGFIEYRETDLIDSERADVSRAIEELRSAVRIRMSMMNDLSCKEPAAFVMGLIDSLPKFNENILWFDAPCVILPSNISAQDMSHAIIYEVMRDGPDTFTLTVVNTGLGAPVTTAVAGRWTKVKDVRYSGLRLKESYEVPWYHRGLLCKGDEGALTDVFFENLMKYEVDTPYKNEKLGQQQLTEMNAWIDTFLLNVEGTNKTTGHEHNVQRSNTCWRKVVASVARRRVKSFPIYKYLETEKGVREMFPEEGPSLLEVAQRDAAEEARVPTATLRKATEEIKAKRLIKALRHAEKNNPAKYARMVEIHGEPHKPPPLPVESLWSKAWTGLAFTVTMIRLVEGEGLYS